MYIIKLFLIIIIYIIIKKDPYSVFNLLILKNSNGKLPLKGLPLISLILMQIIKENVNIIIIFYFI